MSKTVLRPRVAILMGSDSDLAVMSHAAKILERFDVAYELEITSAHRSPERTVEIVRRAQESGTEVFIVGAGGAAHLAGVVAAHTHRPVLGVPLASSDLAGLDALLATVQMPGGVPVGTLAIGAAGGRLRVSQPLVQVPGLVILTIAEGLARFALLQAFRFPAPFGELMVYVVLPQALYNGFLGAALVLALAWVQSLRKAA